MLIQRKIIWAGLLNHMSLWKGRALPGWWHTSARFEAQGFHTPLLAWKWRGPHTRTGEQFLISETNPWQQPQGTEFCWQSDEAREVDFSAEPPDKVPAPPRCQAGEILIRESSGAHPDFWSTQLWDNEYVILSCFNLRWFVIQL